MRSNSETDTRRSDLPVRLRCWLCFISAFSIVDLADGARRQGCTGNLHSPKRDHAAGVSPVMRSRHPMDHAQKRALQGTNEVSGLGLRSLRLPPYTPALFLARCAAIFVTYPAQNLSARIRWWFERLAITCVHGDADKRSCPRRSKRTPNPHCAAVGIDRAAPSNCRTGALPN